MVQLLVFALDRPGDRDAKIEAQRYKRGDVIKVVEDGAPIGTECRRSSWWRILNVPGRVTDYLDLLSSDVEDLQNPDRLLRVRMKRVDLDVLEQEDKQRTGRGALDPADEIAALPARVDAARREHDPIDDPSVIGGSSPRVIG